MLSQILMYGLLTGLMSMPRNKETGITQINTELLTGGEQMKQSRKTVLAAAVAFGMVAGISAGSASAYFTTYATAKGGHTIHLEGNTRIWEEFSQWTKHIRLENTGNAECWVRAKAFAGSGFTLEYSGGDSWSLGEDGYWYYNGILPAAGVTEVLDVKIVLPPGGTDETGQQLPYTEDFNVVVIQECTAVLYREDGTPYADWDALMDSGSDSYGWEEGEDGNEG